MGVQADSNIILLFPRPFSKANSVAISLGSHSNIQSAFSVAIAGPFAPVVIDGTSLLVVATETAAASPVNDTLIRTVACLRSFSSYEGEGK